MGDIVLRGTDGTVSFDGRAVTIQHRWNAPGGRGESVYPIGSVTGAEVKPGVLNGTFTLVVAGGVQRGDSRKNRQGDPLSVQFPSRRKDLWTGLRDAILTAVAGPPQSPPGPAGTNNAGHSGSGLAGQLRELGDLHAAGRLTDEEFAAAKAHVLGGA